MEGAGVPTVVLATTAFERQARRVASAYGLDARIVVVEHPLGGVDEDGVRERAERAVETVLSLVTR
jgi:hypothetical protein